MPSPLNDPQLEQLLERLHAQSEGQSDDIVTYFKRRAREENLDVDRFDDDAHRFFSDKMVALEPEKALFCYQLCRSLQARRVVEAGTSFGVSTLYLAAAVRDNAVENGVVIATEYEPEKAKAARANFEAAKLSDYIELREGDLRETLKTIDGPIDFLLVDIWEVALDALRLVAPHLRPGAVVVCDNTAAHADYYQPYFEFVNDPANRLRTMTLPFPGGLEFTVRV
ncbi:MAG: DUF1442 domain-containing protein [Maricaulaceae bacterium]|jgi:predicted O-methyltransferase YrrM